MIGMAELKVKPVYECQIGGWSFLVRDHLVASDGDYEWYGQHYLNDGKGVYHLCSKDQSKCKTSLPRGDRRELVHISRGWSVF